MEYFDKMDQVIHYLSLNKKDYNDELTAFMKMIENDPEESDYVSWNYKHFNSVWFFNLMEELYKYDTEFIQDIIQSGHLDYILNKLNWRLISRQIDMNDTKFMNIFKPYIDMEFAKIHNPLYSVYCYRKSTK